MPKNNKNSNTAGMDEKQRAEAREAGLIEGSQKTQQDKDYQQSNVSRNTLFLDILILMAIGVLRGYIEYITSMGPTEIYKSLAELKICIFVYLFLFLVWFISLLIRIINYFKMSDSQKKDDKQDTVKDGQKYKSVITKKHMGVLLLIIVIESALFSIEIGLIDFLPPPFPVMKAIPNYKWLMSDIEKGDDEDEEAVINKLSGLVSKNFIAKYPELSMDVILNTTPKDIYLRDYVSPPKCAEISDYNTCVEGQTSVCEKRTINECLKDDLCTLNNDKCVPSSEYEGKENCTYHFDDSDTCSSIEENSDGIWYNLLGKEYNGEVYIDKCGMGEMKNLCEIINTDNELLDTLTSDFEEGNASETPVDICNGGGIIKMCVGQINSGNEGISWAREYKEASTGSGVEVLEERTSFTLPLDGGQDSGICSQLYATPVLDGEDYVYKCLKNSDNSNENIGKYCKITNTSVENKCVPRYVGLSKEKNQEYYKIVESPSCNRLPQSSHDHISTYISEYGDENEDKNIKQCSENYSLRNVGDATDRFSEIINSLKENVSNASTSFEENGEKIMYPYGLLRESNPNELLTFYQDSLSNTAPYRNTGGANPSAGSLASAKKITEEQQKNIYSNPPIYFSNVG